MPRLNKIFTRKGDSGQTQLGGGQTVSKSDARIAVLGDIDELNAWIGTVSRLPLPIEVRNHLNRIQNELFDLGAEICYKDVENEAPFLQILSKQNIHELEEAIDQATAQTGPLENFILPGGGETAAWLHLARTVCRRAERNLVILHQVAGGRELPISYVNRLSDALFVWARLANLVSENPETLWIPGGKR